MVLELLLVSDNLYGNVFFSLVVEALYGLTEGTLPKEFMNFVTVAQVVLQDDLVIALVIVISVVENVHLLQSLFEPSDSFWRLFVCMGYHVAFDLALAILANVIDFFVKV